MIVAEIPATIVVSQINPSPPELSTEFPHETARAGGCVGGMVGSSVGEGVGGVSVEVGVGNGEGVGGIVGETVGATGVGDGGGSVGRMVAGGTVGVMVGPAVGAPVTVGVTVAVDPLGTTRDGRGSGDVEGDDASSGGRMIGAMSDRLGRGNGVGLGCTMLSSATLNKIPPAQVTATIATNGGRKRGTQLMPPDALIRAGGAGSR